MNSAAPGNFANAPSDSASTKSAEPEKDAGDPSFSQRLSALWSRATDSSGDEELESVAPAESFQPEDALALVNNYRQDKGLQPLALHPQLETAALTHAEDLAEHDRISHFGSDGSDPSERVERTGFDAKLAAENVGTGQMTFGELFREWKRSPDHNGNLLLPDATHMGVAVVRKPDTEFKTFWSLVLGAPS